jgi:uridine phosphorylase
MESFQLLHLAACSKGSIRAFSAAIVCANRLSTHVITMDALHELETEGGRAILKALATVP